MWGGAGGETHEPGQEGRNVEEQEETQAQPHSRSPDLQG